MDFVLNGRTHSLDRQTVLARVPKAPPEPIRTHWVQISDGRWPPKQALRVAAGLDRDEPFVTHFAIRVFQRLGFPTSQIPNDPLRPTDLGSVSSAAPQLTDEDAMQAFRRVDAFLAATSLTSTLAALEGRLIGADRAAATAVAADSGFDEDLVDSALVVRARVGMLDSLIHAAVITQVLPAILEPGEKVLKRPSLGAGNDPDRVYDLETTHRVAEFKLSSWKGSDGMRQRGLFADVVGLSLDESGRRRCAYVVGELPVRYLTTSRRNALKALSKAALRVRTPPGLTAEVTVAEFTRSARIEVVDLTSILKTLR